MDTRTILGFVVAIISVIVVTLVITKFSKPKADSSRVPVGNAHQQDRHMERTYTTDEWERKGCWCTMKKTGKRYWRSGGTCHRNHDLM